MSVYETGRDDQDRQNVAQGIGRRVLAVIGTGLNPHNLWMSAVKTGLNQMDAVRETFGREREAGHERTMAEYAGALALSLTPITWGGALADHVTNTVIAGQTGEMQSPDIG